MNNEIPVAVVVICVVATLFTGGMVLFFLAQAVNFVREFRDWVMAALCSALMVCSGLVAVSCGAIVGTGFGWWSA